jgi:hypothetical protein
MEKSQLHISKKLRRFLDKLEMTKKGIFTQPVRTGLMNESNLFGSPESSSPANPTREKLDYND